MMAFDDRQTGEATDPGSAEALEMEVAILRDALARAERRVEELTLLADQDPLAGVLNRRAFVRQLDRAVAGHERHGHKAVLVGVDVDGLRGINDAYGRGAGDAVLAHIGSVISGHVRMTDAVGRLGADDFGVLLAFADEDGARRKMERLVTKLSGVPLEWQGKPLPVQARFALRRVGGDSAEAHLSTLACELHDTKPRPKAIA